jgi:hypothetical protein
MPIVLQMESKVDYLLCSEFVVVFLVLLFTIVHFFDDLLLFDPMTATLMWFIFAPMTTNVMWSEFASIFIVLMLDQYDPLALPSFFVP